MRDDATFSPLGEGFAKLLDRLQGETIPELNLAAHLVCAAVNRGHVCLNLASAFKTSTKTPRPAGHWPTGGPGF